MKLRSDIEKTEQDIKILRRSPRRIDKISALPNCILLYILTFLSTQEVVKTSVLSKRWKNLWKYLPNLITNYVQFRSCTGFRSFVNNFLSHRDRSSALHRVFVDYDGFLSFQIMTKIFKYGISHDVEKITINAFGAGYYGRNIKISNFLHSCRSIKYLNLSFQSKRGEIIFSNTLDLPELTYCRLRRVSLISSNDENTCVDLFSNCKKLVTLFIDCVSLIGKNILFVSNDQLSKLIIRFEKCYVFEYKFQMHTPNLKSFAFAGSLGVINCTPQLFEFDHDLKFLQEASLEFVFREISVEIANTVMSWLKMFNNVYSMTLSSPTTKVISFIPNYPNIEHVRFDNMESLIIKMDPFAPSYSWEILQFLTKKSRPCCKIIPTFKVPLYYYGGYKIEDDET